MAARLYAWGHFFTFLHHAQQVHEGQLRHARLAPPQCGAVPCARGSVRQVAEGGELGVVAGVELAASGGRASDDSP